jgi:proteasome lid subunit RPN8/RPN11
MLADQPERCLIVMQEVYRHAAVAYPNECCGFIRASGLVHRAINDQDNLRAEDSLKWPRSAKEAFSLAPADLYQFGLSFLSSDPAIIVYHSHPDVGAYFSEEDEAGALYEGRPIYDVDHLVVDVRHACPKGAKLFRISNRKVSCVWSQDL